MIRKLRIKMIAAMMISLFVVLAVIITIANLLNFRSITRNADSVLTILADNSGSFPAFKRGPAPNPDSPAEASDNNTDADTPSDDTETPAAPPEHPDSPAPGTDRNYLFDPQFALTSAELPYETRYFSVLYDSTGAVNSTDVSRIASVDSDEAVALADSLINGAPSQGYTNYYRYLICSEDGGTRVIFLDCSHELHGAMSVFLTSCLVAVCGWGAVFILMILVSGRIIAPVTESYEKQRRFITNAGHEIKTPITIINTDADILAMDLGENEWVDDIKAQSARLTSLTSDLIFLTRLDETNPNVLLIDLPFSDLVEETASGFRQAAKSQNKTLTVNIMPLLTVHGDEKLLRQLISSLLDNALKYSPDGSSISLAAAKEGRNIRLTVENATSYTITSDTLKNMFDRFYRADASRNSAKGGYGIGLSIARAVVTTHKGKISASTTDGNDLKITVLLPSVENTELTDNGQ